MSDTIQSEFVEAACEHGQFTESGDSVHANKAHDKVIKIISRMKQLPDKGVSILASLLNDENDSVKAWAATYLLPLDEESAINTLKELSSGRGFIAFDAKMVLKLWTAGTLKLVDWP